MSVLPFECDYMEGCHPFILNRLNEINFEKISGYGCDEICKSAKEKIRVACDCPNAEIHFLVGGTQTNATVIDALLKLSLLQILGISLNMKLVQLKQKGTKLLCFQVMMEKFLVMIYLLF